MPLPSTRDPEKQRVALQQWFRRHWSDAAVGPISVPAGTGFSSETLLFDVTHDGLVESLVARLRPEMSDFPVFPVYDLALQACAMQFVAGHTEVPVPTVRWTEWDDTAIGAPFFVMDRLPGRAPSDMPPYVFGGWLLDLDPRALMTVQRHCVGIHAAVHAIDLTGVDTSWIVPAAQGAIAPDHLDRLLGEQRAFYEWARTGRIFTTIERAFEWLDANRPAPVRIASLNWGDARPGNILFGGADGLTPVAVLDWEMANLGPPEVDVAWMIFLHAFFQSIATTFGLPGIPDFLRRHDVVETYEELAGRRLESIEWYEMYAATRFAIISVRTSDRGVAYGQREAPADLEDLIMHRAMVDAMLDGSYWR